MRNVTIIALVLAALALGNVSCDIFRNATTQIGLSTSDLGTPLEITINITDLMRQFVPGYDALPDQWCDTPLPIPFSVKVPFALPNIPAPSQWQQNPDFQKYKGMFNDVMIDSITYTISGDYVIPASVNQSLLVITDQTFPVDPWWRDASGKLIPQNVIAVAFIPPLPPPLDIDGGQVIYQDGGIGKMLVYNGVFAPGGQDAASDLLKTLQFSMGLLFAETTGQDGGVSPDGGGGITSYNIAKPEMTIDSNSFCYKPKGSITVKIDMHMTFRVAPFNQ
jgi:hypothetical protein